MLAAVEIKQQIRKQSIPTPTPDQDKPQRFVSQNDPALASVGAVLL